MATHTGRRTALAVLLGGTLLHATAASVAEPAVLQINYSAVSAAYTPVWVAHGEGIFTGGLVSVLTLEGERLAQWGDPSFHSCHSIWGDLRGDLYVVRPGTSVRTRRIVKHVRLR